MRKAIALFTTQSGRRLVRNISSLENVSSRREYLNTKFHGTPSRLGLNRSYCEIQGSICWNCQAKSEGKDQFFCGKCGSLQDVNSKCDYFKLYSLSNSFNLNPTELTTRFRQLQSTLHPDKYSNKSKREQTNSLEWSSLVNKAYKTLSVPIDRGEYLLQQQGISIPEDNSTLDKEFLMEMMEKNEEVEEATKDNILELLQTVQNELKEAAVELEEIFNQNDFEKAKFLLIRMKYFRSLEKNIKDKAVRLGAVK
ncbi:unnamed protein product [Hermetia illucens]|uniref:J domain-containing protein n=1 Tax=Hermetia illucens TaxID=343691 RepID=A0A7R8UVF5_HERIL|nr:iron-sulfur cluster co-chaperone protein HscB [Hermetia illucens]CAD7086633.1 unnamed protein product [Hermetia illucens]